MSDDINKPEPKPDDKVPPETLELRARPQPITRINRKVLIGGAAVVLLLIYVLNFLDRGLLGVLSEPIITDLKINDFQFGLLTGPAFAIFYSLIGVPLAFMSETRSRVWIMAICVALWSAATTLTLNAWRNIAINAEVVGNLTTSALTLNAGQGNAAGTISQTAAIGTNALTATTQGGAIALAQLPEVMVVAKRETATQFAATQLPEIVVVAKRVAQMVAQDDQAALLPTPSINAGF